MSYLQEQRWYQTGRDAANAEANEEQRKRIEEARAAAADAADVNSLHDPRNRDNR